MHILEFDGENHPVKFIFDKVMFLTAPDRSLIDDLILALSGKAKGASFDRAEINKASFSTAELTDLQDLATELKYGSKSVLWKRISSAYSKHEVDLNIIMHLINDQFIEIAKIIDKELGVNRAIEEYELLDLIELLKKNYYPIEIESLTRNEQIEEKYNLILPAIWHKNNFVIINDPLLKEISFLDSMLEMTKSEDSPFIIVITSDANLIYHFYKKYPVYNYHFGLKNFHQILSEIDDRSVIEFVDNSDLFMFIFANAVCTDKVNNYLNFIEKNMNHLEIIDNIRKIYNFYNDHNLANMPSIKDFNVVGLDI